MHRVARFDELGSPSGAAPTARDDGLDEPEGAGGPSTEEEAVRLAPSASPVEGAPAAGADATELPAPAAHRVADLGAAGGDLTPAERVRAASDTVTRAPAPVAELGAADGQRTSGSILARLGEAGGRVGPHQEALLIVPHESGRRAREHPLDDQQRSRGPVSGTGGSGGAAAAAGTSRDRRSSGGPNRSDRASGDTEGRPAREPGARRGGPKQIDPDADPVAAAREICLRLLTDRARTRHELAQALRQRGVPDEAAASVLERFDEVGLIDDAAFAGQWVRSRHNHRGLARRAIAMELRRKGVDGEVAEEALGEVDDDAEAGRARELVDRKLRTVPADTPDQRKKAANRLVGMLARKGYGGGIAYRVVREALAAHGAEIDELGTDPVD